MHPHRLSDDQISFYRDNGYLVVPNVLTEDELAGIRSAVDDVYSQRIEGHDSTGRDPLYDRVFAQKVNLWQVHEGIRRHTMNPRLAAMALQLSGAPALRVWHDQTLVKRPNDAAATPYHQDLAYWPMLDDGALTCWTALDDVTRANGCLLFVPKSHTWGERDPVDFKGETELSRIVPDHAGDLETVAAEIPAGSVTFHHCLTFHGATTNTTDRPRRAMIIHYMPDGTRYSGKGHCVTDDRSLEVGQPMCDDTLWPIVASQDTQG